MSSSSVRILNDLPDGQSQEEDENDMEANTNGNRDLIFLGICLVSVYMLTMGALKMDGIYFLPYQEKMNASAAEISSVYSTSGGVFFFLAPVFGASFKLMGARACLLTASIFMSIGTIAASMAPNLFCLFLFYSIIRAAGMGMGNLCVFTISGKSYKHKRALINNLFGATSAGFAATFAPLVQLGFHHYTWEGVMLINGAIIMNAIPIGWLASRFYMKIAMKEESSTDTKIEETSKRSNTSILFESFDFDMLKDNLFLLYCIGNAFNQMVRVLYNTYLVRYAQSIGISNETSSIFITIYQASFIGSTLLSGYLMSKISSHAAKTRKGLKLDKSIYNRISLDRTVMVKTSSLIATVSFLQAAIAVIPLIWKSFTVYAVYASLCGILSGTSGGHPISIVVELFGSKRLSSGMGFRGFFLGLFYSTIPPIIGMIVDVVGNYQPALYANMIFGLLGAACFLLLQTLYDQKNRETTNIEDDKAVA